MPDPRGREVPDRVDPDRTTPVGGAREEAAGTGLPGGIAGSGERRGVGFQDHFSAQARRYARFRPAYPDALFDWLADLAPLRVRAWDCATGSGQAAGALRLRFSRVVASDGSVAQLAHARRAPRVDWCAALAEAVPLAAGAIDLTVVAQAAHWLDLERFYRELRRVSRPGGVVALASYALISVGPEVDPLVAHFHDTVIGPCWPPERSLIGAAYRRLPFPFAEVMPPPFALTAEWTLEELTGYLGTWSGVARYRRQVGEDPVPSLVAKLDAAWGAGRRPVRWPLHLRVGRVEG